jgi:hypothetical protein
MNWADLFEHAETYETDVAAIREALAVRREDGTQIDDAEEGGDA